MRPGQIAYRVGQFWEALGAGPDQADLKLAQTYLNPAQMELFARMQPSEQAHSMRVYKHLMAEPLSRDADRDLLVAALLHDVGKSRYPLTLWERVLIVLLRSLFPQQSRSWGAERAAREGSLERLSWHRPFIISEQHPHWGAEMAAAAGASTLTVSLILRHQDAVDNDPVTLEDCMLKRLQAADSAC